MKYNKKILAFIIFIALSAPKNHPMDFFKKTFPNNGIFSFATGGILTGALAAGTLFKNFQDRITAKQQERLTELEGKLQNLALASQKMGETLAPLPEQIKENTQAITGQGENHTNNGLIGQVDGIEKEIANALAALKEATSKKDELETSLKTLQEGEGKHQGLAQGIQKHIDEQTDQITLQVTQITGLNAQAELYHKELLQKISELGAQTTRNAETTATVKFEAEKVNKATQQLKETTIQEAEGLQQRIVQAVATQYMRQLSAGVKEQLATRERKHQEEQEKILQLLTLCDNELTKIEGSLGRIEKKLTNDTELD